MPDPIIFRDWSNEKFLLEHARPGRIGIVGGTTLVDRLIHRGQRHAIDGKTWSTWSHAFLFQGQRADGHHWVIESDLTVHRKHIQLGVQENRMVKFFDETKYAALAVLDLGLTPEQERRLFARALDLVAGRARYSVRELFGTLWALKRPGAVAQENKLSRDQAFYCSAFVRHLFTHAGIELLESVSEKNTTPEHIAQTPLARQKWVMVRELPPSLRKKRTKTEEKK